jgi:starch synthase
MRYGTLPLVRHVGGLADTVVDATEWTVRAGNATGFAFRDLNAVAMLACLDRALAFYARPVSWRKIQRRAMSREFGWNISARRYIALYRKLAPLAAQRRMARAAVWAGLADAMEIEPPAVAAAG